METRQEYAERLRHLMLQVDWHGGIAEDEELTLTTRHFEESDKKRFGIVVTTRNAQCTMHPFPSWTV